MLSREDKAEQSVQDFLRAEMATRGYVEGERLHYLDSFPHDRLATPIDSNYIASGFSFDSGGKPLELGSNLKERIYTVEFFIFALDAKLGRNLANQVKDCLEPASDTIALKDYDQPGAPVVDHLLVDSVWAAMQVIPDPRPWEKNAWVTTLRLRDEYYA